MTSTPLLSPKVFRARRSGFTLPELLTVIAIIGVLAGILIPIVGRVRDTANSSQCMSNLRQIGVALKLYTTDHQNTLPPTYTWTATASLAKGEWTKQLGAYLPARGTSKVNEVFVCPAADYHGVTGNELSNTYGAAGAFMGIAPAGSYVTETVARKLTTIDNLPNAPWIFDMHANGNNPYPYNSAQWTVVQSDVTGAESVRLGFRHGAEGKLNMLFGDGHVQGLTRADILAAFTFKKWDAR
jgi:prepilin-type N-terminal cleavage/methylation domain-containing protein/prepilin-type processing-associated H-X9-DG protein